LSSSLHSPKARRAGFVFSIDAAFAVIIVTSAILATQSGAFSYSKLTLNNLKDSAEGSFAVMQETGFLFSETDNNSLPNAAHSFYAHAKALLPSGSGLTVTVSQYNLNKEACRNFKDFEHCFSLAGSGSFGDLQPSNDIAFGKYLVVKRQSPGDCNVSAQFSPPPLQLKSPFGALFADLNSSDSNLSVGVSVSRLGIPLGNNGSISCDENLTVDLNAVVKSFGRSAADTMLVMDRSGSMSWTGDAEFGATNNAVWVDRNYAFLPDSSGFDDYNVANPNLPLLVGNSDSGNFSDIAVLGNYAFFTDTSNDRLRIYSVSSPQSPSLSGTASGFTNPQELAVKGNYAFVADGSSGLRVVNVANKASPSISRTFPIGTATNVFALSDKNLLFAVTTSSGSYIDFDTSAGSAQDSFLKAGGYTVDTSEGTARDTFETIGRNASNSWAGQSFIPYTSSVKDLNLYLMKTGSPSGDLTVSLRSSISGANLVSATIPRASITTSYKWHKVSFASAYSVVPSSTYYIVLTTTGTSNSNYFRFGANDSEPYADGTAYQQSTAQSTDAFLQIIDSSSTAGQSFVPNASSVKDFDLYLSRTSTSPSSALTVSLRSSISGADLASTTIPASSVGTSYVWVSGSFASSVSVIPSSTYYFVLSSGAMPSSNYYLWGSSSSNPYSSGTAYRQEASFPSTDAFVRSQKSLFAGLHAFDISSPLSLNYYSSYSTSGVTGISANDSNIVFLSRGNNGLQIVSFASVFSPSLSSNISLNGTSNNLSLSGSFAYVANDSNLYEVNVSSISSPFVSRNFYTPYGYNDVFIDRDFAFLATQGGGMLTIDLLNGEKMAVAKAAGGGFVDFNDWKPEDQIGIVSFGNSATTNRTLLRLTDLNKTTLKRDLNALLANGATAMGDAMHNARLELNSARHNASALKFMVLMTDGQSNAGFYDPIQEAHSASSAGIRVFTVGFGPDVDEAVLQQIADITDANYYYAGDANSLYSFFQLIAQDIGIISEQYSNFNAAAFSLNLAVNPGTSIVPSSINVSRGSYSLSSGLLSFSVPDINRFNPWFASYNLSFPCNSDYACDYSKKRFPEGSSFFEYSVGGSPFTVFFDSNSYFDVNFLYRNLELSFSNAELYDINHLFVEAKLSNTGDLNSYGYPSGLTDANVYANGILQGPLSFNSLCSQKNPSCSFWNDLNSIELFREGEINVSIDANKTRDCPRGNSVTITCTSDLVTQFYVIEYGVWNS